MLYRANFLHDDLLIDYKKTILKHWLTLNRGSCFICFQILLSLQCSSLFHLSEILIDIECLAANFLTSVENIVS